MVDVKVKTIPNEKDNRLALKIELNFRQKIIGVKCKRSFFILSSGDKMKPVSELKWNFKHVISWNSNIQRENVVAEGILNDQKITYKESATKMTKQQKEKDQRHGRKRANIHGSGHRGRKRVKVIGDNGKKVPVICSPSDLVGKVIDHFCFLDKEDTESWFRGVVTQMLGKNRFVVRYNDFSDETYVQPLYKHFKAGNVELLELEPVDQIGASIRHLYTDEDSGEDRCWNAEVVDLGKDSEDAGDPCFFIMYDENGEAEEGQQEKQEYYLEPLLGNHLNNWVQIISLDLDGDVGDKNDEDGSI